MFWNKKSSDEQSVNKLMDRIEGVSHETEMTQEEFQELITNLDPPNNWLPERWSFIRFDHSGREGMEEKIFPKCKYRLNRGNLLIHFHWPDGEPGTFKAWQGSYLNLTIEPHDSDRWKE